MAWTLPILLMKVTLRFPLTRKSTSFAHCFGAISESHLVDGEKLDLIQGEGRHFEEKVLVPRWVPSQAASP
jgi:hypothetical protein